MAVRLRPSARGACWYGRPATCRSLAQRPPFCASSRTVRLDVCGIDCDSAPDAAVAGQRLENPEPDALPAPAIEAIINRCVRPVLDRAITPACAYPKHVNDPGDHPAVVYTMSSASPAWQKRLNTSPLPIAQPSQRPRHHCLRQNEGSESAITVSRNSIEYGA